MASSSSNSSFFHVPRTKYDVFISFRGEDTRTSFLSHLVKELRHNQINFYVDDDKLHPGDEISSTLLQAIEEAFISLVIFSKCYASSSWCMEELVKIIECMERDQRIVIPVFYNVDPSDVRHQKRTFGEAFDTQQDKLKENIVQVQSWRSALNKAANLSGFHYPSKYQNESELIEKIIEDILEKLSHIFSSESKGLVGIDECFESIESLLAIKSSKVRILGIWGMGGIGKTTIAEAIFDKYSSQYEGCCFLKNVGEAIKYGLSYLCEKLVFELLEGENLLLKGPAKARSTTVKRILSRKKVFIVLDNVDTLDQLEHLTGEQICLGPGSRIIVTTRDKQILRNVHGIYEIRKLNFENSFQLFCLNAFGKVYPKAGYEKLSIMAVDYANGIPLALKVLGSFLYPRSIEAWESALRKLKIYPNKDIFNVLKLSYDGLDDLERNIFLDIAFCFKGKDKDDVVKLLDSCGFFASIGIDNLLQKALITISNRNIIEMHDLIEQMGWEIVRQESIKDPAKRSRLRDPEDVYNVLKHNRGTYSVEGIILDLSQIRDLHLNADTFKKMPKIRFLKFYNHGHQRSSNVYIPTTLESFLDELRYLEWDGYPSKSLPSAFCTEKLVELHMPHSHISKLWDGVLDLPNLKIVDLSQCKQLEELPDFTKASNLKRINLRQCERLRHLHPSIFSIDTLEILCLNGCKELKSFKSENHLKSLKHLGLEGCSSPEEFLMSSKQLIYLDLGDLRLKSLPNELCSLISLEELRLSGCKELIELPHNMKALSRLEILLLSDCESLQSLPELPSSLRRLYASNCTSLETTFNLKAVFSINRTSISFQNCTRLDEHSLNDIMEDAYLTMVRATIRDMVVKIAHLCKRCKVSEFQNEKDCRSEIKGKVCYPGSKVPEWFKYQTRQAFIIVELDEPCQLLGFFVCCVTPQLPPDIQYLEIVCQYYLGDGESGIYGREVVTVPYKRQNRWIAPYHVCTWYDPFGCDRILEAIKKCSANDHCTTYNQKIFFKFTVGQVKEFRQEKGQKMQENSNFAKTYEHDYSIKGCGVFPIYTSDILDSIQKVKLELELDDKSKIYEDIDELQVLKSEMILKMKEQPVPQGNVLDLYILSHLQQLARRMKLTKLQRNNPPLFAS